jgi:enterochelin esterase-like enzyme
MLTPTNFRFPTAFLHAALLLIAMAVAGCGGGGGNPVSPDTVGSAELRVITSSVNGTSYPLRIYLPPANAGNRADLPVVYALDGDWWYDQLVSIATSSRSPFIVVAIGNNANRAIDYVPQNSCTPSGGGQAAYLDFIRSDLIPFIESNFGGSPNRRALLGHSHGGSFVFYALFAERAGTHHFSAYLSSDSSIGCMPQTVEAWEAAYAAAEADLPIRLHVSHAGNNPNGEFAQRIQNRGYPRLTLQAQAYSGTHTGIIPAAFTDALSFAFSR